MKDLSKDQLVEVIKNGDDNLTNMVVVSNQGDFLLFPYEKHSDNTDVFSYDFAVVNGDSFQPHNGYIGVEAANDEEFVTNEYNRVNKAWQRHLKTRVLERAFDVYGL
ncbi:hypothetical protein [Lactiplantibacillus plantarum]|uniref:hypothetical protein n=1 Tax=Lactiplantibacillus plantarum TaxID=1590 RepID=UPI003C262BA3